MFFRELFRLRDYTVTKAYLEYITPKRRFNTFWKNEENDWGDASYYTCRDVTKTWKQIGTPPEEVKSALLSIEYEYDGTQYECVTKNMNMTWPPIESKDATFTMPISRAMLMDKDLPVKNVTNELKRKMGPRKDFHNQVDVLVEELFEYDDYTDVMVTNAINRTKKVDRTASCLELL